MEKGRENVLREFVGKVKKKIKKITKKIKKDKKTQGEVVGMRLAVDSEPSFLGFVSNVSVVVGRFNDDVGHVGQQ